MASAHDVAKYILEKHGPMSAMKLQKLVYYSQVWSLVWDDRPMFGDNIEAWANGPVVYTLWQEHQGSFSVSEWAKGDVNNLDGDSRATIDLVLDSYGDKSAQYLSDLTHQELPWKMARGTTPEGENSRAVITLDSMMEYYQSLYKY